MSTGLVSPEVSPRHHRLYGMLVHIQMNIETYNRMQSCMHSHIGASGLIAAAICTAICDMHCDCTHLQTRDTHSRTTHKHAHKLHITLTYKHTARSLLLCEVRQAPTDRFCTGIKRTRAGEGFLYGV